MLKKKLKKKFSKSKRTCSFKKNSPRVKRSASPSSNWK